MPEYKEIRATYDLDTITVYQSYNQNIGSLAAKNNKFVEPFSFNRMTWIKPSFLWMMERSNYGQKSNQECTLAIKIKRNCFEKALSEAVLTKPSSSIYKDKLAWEEEFKNSRIHVQWDPERDIHGQKLDFRSIQVGISRHLIKEFNDEWIVKIDDISPFVKKINALRLSGDYTKAKSFLPKERIYDLPPEICLRLGMKKL